MSTISFKTDDTFLYYHFDFSVANIGMRVLYKTFDIKYLDNYGINTDNMLFCHVFFS